MASTMSDSDKKWASSSRRECAPEDATERIASENIVSESAAMAGGDSSSPPRRVLFGNALIRRDASAWMGGVLLPLSCVKKRWLRGLCLMRRHPIQKAQANMAVFAAAAEQGDTAHGA